MRRKSKIRILLLLLMKQKQPTKNNWTGITMSMRHLIQSSNPRNEDSTMEYR